MKQDKPGLLSGSAGFLPVDFINGGNFRHLLSRYYQSILTIMI